MNSQHQNEIAGSNRVGVRPASNGILVIKALIYLAAGIFAINFIARITLGY